MTFGTAERACSRTYALALASVTLVLLAHAATPSRARQIPQGPIRYGVSEGAWGEVVSGVQVAVDSPCRQDYRIGAPVEVVLSMRNVSEQPLHYGYGGPLYDYRFEVVDSHGIPAEPTEFFKGYSFVGSRFGEELLPGEGVQDVFDLTQIYVLEANIDYSVVVTRRVPNTNGTGEVQATSRPLHLILAW